MENCLWQEFKEDTNNDSLKKLGVLRIYLKAHTGTDFILKHYEDLTPCNYFIYDLEGNLLSSGQSRSSSLPNSPFYVNIPSGGGYIEITNKYNLYSMGNNFVDIPGKSDLQPKVAEYMYCEHLHNIYACDYMAEYAKLPSIVDINFGAQQKGDILDYVNLIRQKETTGDIFFSIYRGVAINVTVKFNGRIVVSSTSSTTKDDRLFWDADKCYVRAWNGKIIYCYGYTDAQIAELTNTGGDWEGATVTKVD